ncbi:MAG: PTS sugar transporter subunit IIA [Chlamydiia bacterium]|nr:PTS sugar transporter subunit IIA [Chlamydiia bacterium]
MFRVTPYLNNAQVLFMQGTSRDQILEALVACAQQQHKIESSQDFLKAILEREQVVTTGVGLGIAVPHAKLESLDEFFLCIAILDSGVDWHAIDSSPVRIVCLIGGPDHQQTEYLQLLSGVTSVLKDEENRKKLLKAKTTQDVLECFREAEEYLGE